MMTPIVNQSIVEDGELEINFLVEDIDTDLFSLVVTASSSDTNLFANEDFEYVNNGASRMVRTRPLPNRFGPNEITITLRDTDGSAISNTFTVFVSAVNDPPSISAIASASTSIGQPAAQLPFSIGDIENTPEQLGLRAFSSNTNLAPISAIQFSGSGSNRFVRVTPAAGQSGFSLITVQVQDPEGAVTQSSFELVVNDTNGPPVVALDPASQRVNVGASVTLRVIATGPGPLSYRWQKDTVEISGQTNATLNFASVQRADTGAYRAVISNANGSVTSAAANLQVFAPARILSVSRSGNVVEVIAESATGQRYTLEYCDNFGTGSWTALNTLDGTGASITFTDASAAPASRFYRLRIE
ncbi:MAG TPA: immunoglobulin domain-containing protein, partial [Verrucomicrobiae bacterium]|nr:immunoglobulin domain-containing protein [Verrucomicrobiae bacterium]